MEPRPDESHVAVNRARYPNGEPARANAGHEGLNGDARDTEVHALNSSYGIDAFASEHEGESAPPLPVSPEPARSFVDYAAPSATRVTHDEPEREPVSHVVEFRANFDEDATEDLAEPQDEVWPAAVKEPAQPTPAMSLAELLENTGPVDWPEAVAIAQRICRAVSRHPTAGAHEYLLDTRHVEITEHGEVHLLPGAPGGDPLVKQVGRILRALLEGGTAPLQLRLVASQAAFELPGYATVNELSETLRSFEQAPESDAIRMAFLRGREARLSSHDHDSGPRVDVFAARSLVAPIDPPTWADLVQKTTTTASYHHTPLAVLSVVMVAAIAFFSVRWMGVSGARQLPPPSRVETRVPLRTERVEAPTPSAAPILPSAPSASATVLPPERARAAIVRPPSVPASVPQVNSQPAETVRSATAQPVLSPNNVEERTGVPEPNTEKNVFDSIVLANPLYQLDPARSTPDAIAQLRSSKRSILPSIARRDYERAREYLEDGDNERALVEGNRVMRMLDDRDIGPLPAGLRDSVEQLLVRATAAKTSDDQRVYSVADRSVTPPTAIGRQLPVAPPIGLANQLVGTLEMVISQEGEVEAVRLHTPLNRYHERMIVSAAKAWRYRPAIKDGKPVKYRLISSINLPES